MEGGTQWPRPVVYQLGKMHLIEYLLRFEQHPSRVVSAPAGGSRDLVLKIINRADDAVQPLANERFWVSGELKVNDVVNNDRFSEQAEGHRLKADIRLLGEEARHPGSRTRRDCADVGGDCDVFRLFIGMQDHRHATTGVELNPELDGLQVVPYGVRQPHLPQ